MAPTTQPDEGHEILERGNIYFLYRPKVQEADSEPDPAEGPGDVQNLYLVLKPQGGKFRLINIGRDRLPDIDRHERNWGFVEMIATSGKEIEEALREETYPTKTRGERLRPAARPAGEGVYATCGRGGRCISSGSSSCRNSRGRSRRRSRSRRQRASPSRSRITRRARPRASA